MEASRSGWFVSTSYLLLWCTQLLRFSFCVRVYKRRRTRPWFVNHFTVYPSIVSLQMPQCNVTLNHLNIVVDVHQSAKLPTRFSSSFIFLFLNFCLNVQWMTRVPQRSQFFFDDFDLLFLLTWGVISAAPDGTRETLPTVSLTFFFLLFTGNLFWSEKRNKTRQ